MLQPHARLFALALVLFTLALAGCGSTVRATPTTVAKPAAEVKLQILSYNELEQLLAGHKGRVVVLDVWSSSCAPCVKEFPHLVELSQKHQAADVACVSLNVDYYGGKKSRPEDFHDDVLKRLKDWNATFDNVLSKDEDTAVLAKLELTAPPGVYVYGRDGKLAQKFNNDNARTEAEYFTYAQIGDLVEKLVEKK